MGTKHKLAAAGRWLALPALLAGAAGCRGAYAWRCGPGPRALVVREHAVVCAAPAPPPTRTVVIERTVVRPCPPPPPPPPCVIVASRPVVIAPRCPPPPSPPPARRSARGPDRDDRGSHGERGSEGHGRR